MTAFGPRATVVRMDVQHFLSVQNTLGEGPIWNSDDQRLYWVDAFGEKYQSCDPRTSAVSEYPTGRFTIALAFRESGGMLVASDTMLGFQEMPGGTLKDGARAEFDTETVRFNDGKADPSGQYFIGAMHREETEPRAGLYRLGTDGRLTLVQDDVITSNGLGWSPDRSIFYFTDTMRYTIWAYDYDPARGEIGRRRVFADLSEEQGRPDGLCVDAEGKLWVAMWGGHQLLHLDSSGRKVQSVPMPVPKPTSCAFGGSDLSQLFVTSARVGLSEQELAQYPQSGDVFLIPTDTQGQEEYRYKG